MNVPKVQSAQAYQGWPFPQYVDFHEEETSFQRKTPHKKTESVVAV